jgi:hypothetical protein
LLKNIPTPSTRIPSPRGRSEPGTGRNQTGEWKNFPLHGRAQRESHTWASLGTASKSVTSFAFLQGLSIPPKSAFGDQILGTI